MDADAAVVVAFVASRADLETRAAVVFEHAIAGGLAWIAYPKARKLGTDLTRDVLKDAVAAQGLRPVRQVSLDDTWTALRLRPV